METIKIPQYETASLDDIAPGLTGLRLLFVNVFAAGSAANGWVLIDAGIPHSAGAIKSWAAKLFGDGVRPRAIVLTHGHFDHAGALEDLASEWDVPVYAHELELPFIMGRAKYPPPNPEAGGGLMTVMSPLYPAGPVNVGSRAHALPGDGSVPGMPGWKWIHTPGHTPGHVSFFREHDRTLLVGDAFCTVKAESFLAIAQQRPELHGPPAYYTPDWPAAKRSVVALAALQPNVIAPGHGLPIHGTNTAAAVDLLAKHFDEVAGERAMATQAEKEKDPRPA